MSGEDENPFDGPVQIPIDGVLDLHSIRPRDVKEVLLEYLIECRKAGIFEIFGQLIQCGNETQLVSLVSGKGTMDRAVAQCLGYVQSVGPTL